MSIWAMVVGLLAACFVGSGLFVGAGSWLSGTPSWRVGRVVLAVSPITALLVLIWGSASGLLAYERGWVGPRFPFELHAPAGYGGAAAVRFCPTEGQSPTGPVLLDELGIGAVAIDPADNDNRREVDVVFPDGSRTLGDRRGTWPDAPCEWLVFEVGRGAYYDVGPDIESYLARARATGLPLSTVIHQLPFVLVVPVGYRDELVLEHCPAFQQGLAGPAEVVVGADGVATVPTPIPHSVDGGLAVRDANGTPLVGRAVRSDFSGTCSLLEVRVGDQDPGTHPPRSSLMPSQLLQRVRTGGTPYREVAGD